MEWISATMVFFGFVGVGIIIGYTLGYDRGQEFGRLQKEKEIVEWVQKTISETEEVHE